MTSRKKVNVEELFNLMNVGPYLQRYGGKIDLSLNESHHQVPERIKAAIAASLNHLHEYPLSREADVTAEVAKFYGVAAAQVAITHGLDEALDRLIQRFSGMRFSFLAPAFIGYKVRLKLNKIDYQVIPLDERFAIPEAAFSRLDEDDFVILANPNNPTGTVLDEGVLDRLQSQYGKLFIDEAYIDFSNARTRLDRLDDRIFVFRSLSKIFALAGLRLGFLFGTEANMAPIKNQQWFCNINIVALEAIHALLDDEFISENAALVVRGREDMQCAATELGFDVRESFGNFVLIRQPNNKHLIQFLDSLGIGVTDTSVFGLKDHVRISVGTTAENEGLVEGLRRYASQFDVRSSDAA
jgi:histidinol-phosphate/aromatic aminotransferase/cobyric acid decarboxylase-like protein